MTNSKKQTVKICLIEQIAHEFDIDVSNAPDDVDIKDAYSILEWAADMDLLDYSNGEPIGDNEIYIEE